MQRGDGKNRTATLLVAATLCLVKMITKLHNSGAFTPCPLPVLINLTSWHKPWKSLRLRNWSSARTQHKGTMYTIWHRTTFRVIKISSASCDKNCQNNCNTSCIYVFSVEFRVGESRCTWENFASWHDNLFPFICDNKAIEVLFV